MHRAPNAILHRQEPADITINTPRDPNTLSNYHNFRTTHTAVNFHIDFDKKSLAGNVVLKLESITEAEVDEIVLDTSYLNVTQIDIAGKPARWNIGSGLKHYGCPLSIKLSHGLKKHEHVELKIFVSTTSKCTALQWLTAAQTSNRKHPYMFSQCQAIHARSLFPCQDTPDVKSTFEFTIRSPLPVLASGLPGEIVKVANSDDSIYHFKQDIPIPSYLFAIASGDLASASIGPRSTVWTSSDKLESAKWELENDTETFLQAAEKIVYPYAWGSFNVLVLPPSFPYGGMENPIYTFVTPTLISGDRQNVDTIAHELSHSWSGNLVSNASWEHFWLNEGWTTYLERRLQAAVHGEPFRDFSAIIGWKALQDAMEMFGEDHEFTKLIIDLKGKDPDDAFSTIPYEKGFTFLYYLEKVLSRDKWDKFIPHYFETFKYKSLDSYEFKACLLSFFESDHVATEALTRLDWDTWFYAPGFPPKPDFDTTMVDVCYALAEKWEALAGSSTGKDFDPTPADVESWIGNQKVVFLERVQRFSKPLTPALVEKMGDVYAFAKSQNAEIVSRYFTVGLKAKAESIYEPTAELLGKLGRMKFVRPLYRGLKECDQKLALKTFEENREFYHPICRAMVEKDLYGKE